MFKQSRIFFSATMIAFLFVSTLILSTGVSAKSGKCPVELPRTLLSLYLASDLVVIADFKNESVTKTETEDENGYYADIKRDLDVSKTFKGQKTAEVSFIKSEYKSNAKSGENEDKVVYLYGGEMVSDQLKIGDQYLFFLKTNEETGEFYPTDYRSAGREINLDNSGIYEKRLNELGKIIANNKNQLPNLAEWLVDLTEDEATRWDGAATLSRSFSSLKYEEVNEETEETEEAKPTLDEDFNEYSSAIAKQITDAQKDRLSSVFITSLNQSLLSNEKDVDYDYEFAELVGNWDRARLAMYGYSLLLATDKSDVEKTRRAMNFVANMSGDNTLSSIFYEYTETQREEENEPDTEADKDLPVFPAETAIEKTETEIQVEKNEPNAESIVEKVETENEDEIMTEVQIREQILQKFSNRYQELLTRNFAPEVEADIAETTEETIK